VTCVIRKYANHVLHTWPIGLRVSYGFGIYNICWLRGRELFNC